MERGGGVSKTALIVEPPGRHLGESAALLSAFAQNKKG